MANVRRGSFPCGTVRAKAQSHLLTGAVDFSRGAWGLVTDVVLFLIHFKREILVSVESLWDLTWGTPFVPGRWGSGMPLLLYFSCVP